MARSPLGRLRAAIGARRKQRERRDLKAARREEVREQYRAWYPLQAPGRGRLNVLLLVQSRRKPTSSTYIRMLGPLTHPAFGRRVGLDLLDQNSFHLSKGIDVCIVQRTAVPDREAAGRLVHELRARGVRLVVETDDAFGAIDGGHPQHGTLSEPVAALELLLREADEVWVSTPELARVLDLERPPVVVPNSLDERIWPLADESLPVVASHEPLRILYMGTATHAADLTMLLPALDRLHAEHPGEFVVTTIGVSKELPERPWLERLTPEASVYPSFVSWLATAGPFDIGLAPLVDTAFNRCKSDIKCLDYLAVGVRPVVSDVLPYASPELDDLVERVPNTPDAWYEALAGHLGDRASARQAASARSAAGRRYLRERREVATTAAVLGERLARLARSR